jgi:hypothetical protein
MENKIIFTQVLLLCLFFSCTSSYQKTNSIPINKQWSVGTKDTTLQQHFDNSFITYYFFGDTNYRIEWGNETIKNKTKNNYEVLGNGVLSVMEFNERTIVLGQGCGTSCFYYIFLPLEKDAIEKSYYFAYAYDIEKNIVVFLPENKDFLRIENFYTQNKLDIEDPNLCFSTFEEDFIENISFNDTALILSWNMSELDTLNNGIKEKIIPLNELLNK